MARKKAEVNTEEVDEIINLKLRELGGLKSKLTYNNVWNYNKELVKNKKTRSNGKPYNLYGYTFWASGYNGEDYYGKKKIDEVKTAEEIVLVGTSYTKDVQDILLLVDKYKSSPQELSKKLVKIFESDRKKINLLSEQNNKLNDEITKLREEKAKLEEGFATVFYSSINESNSLNDVMSIRKSGDEFVKDSLRTMFNSDENKINQILTSKKIAEVNKVTKVDFVKKENNKKSLEMLFPE